MAKQLKRRLDTSYFNIRDYSLLDHTIRPTKNGINLITLAKDIFDELQVPYKDECCDIDKLHQIFTDGCISGKGTEDDPIIFNEECFPDQNCTLELLDEDNNPYTETKSICEWITEIYNRKIDLTCIKEIEIPGKKYINTSAINYTPGYSTLRTNDFVGGSVLTTNDGNQFEVRVYVDYINLDGSVISQSSLTMVNSGEPVSLVFRRFDQLLASILDDLGIATITHGYTDTQFYVRGNQTDNFKIRLEAKNSSGFIEDTSNFIANNSGGSGNSSFNYDYSLNNSELVIIGYYGSRYSLRLKHDDDSYSYIDFYNVDPNEIILDDTVVEALAFNGISPYIDPYFRAVENVPILIQEPEIITEEKSICETLTDHEERITELENQETDCNCEDLTCTTTSFKKYYEIPENFTNRVSEVIIYEKENIPFESASLFGTSLQFSFQLQDNSGTFFYKNTLVYIDIPNGSYFADLKTQLLTYIEEVTIYLTDTFPDLDVNYIVEDIIHEGKPAIKIKIENNNELIINFGFYGKSGQNLITRPSDIIGFVHNNSYNNLYNVAPSGETISVYLPTKFTINSYTVYPNNINHDKVYIEENEEDPIIKLTIGSYTENPEYNAGELYMIVPIQNEVVEEEASICEIISDHEERISELENNSSPIEINALNGIYLDEDSNIKLGGELIEDTLIESDNHKFTLDIFKISNSKSDATLKFLGNANNSTDQGQNGIGLFLGNFWENLYASTGLYINSGGERYTNGFDFKGTGYTVGGGISGKSLNAGTGLYLVGETNSVTQFAGTTLRGKNNGTYNDINIDPVNGKLNITNTPTTTNPANIYVNDATDLTRFKQIPFNNLKNLINPVLLNFIGDVSVTGTTNETIIQSIKIDPIQWKENAIYEMFGYGSFTASTSSSATLNLYLNDTNDLLGTPILIQSIIIRSNATYSSVGGASIGFDKKFIKDFNNIYVNLTLPAVGTNPQNYIDSSNITNTTALVTEYKHYSNIDFNVDKYLIFSVVPASSSQVVKINALKIKEY